MAAAPPSPKRARTSKDQDDKTYHLLYHPTIPGRGECIRLIFEATQTPYVDVSNATKDDVYSILSKSPDQAHPPIFALPALRVSTKGSSSSPSSDDLIISQTTSIVEYLGHELGLAPGPPQSAANLHARQLALTALDLTVEAHDSHHPISVEFYYEDQAVESKQRAENFRSARLPKFLAHLEAVLAWNAVDADGRRGKGRYVVGDKLSYADLVWWQVIDGLLFAFPNELAARKPDYSHLFTKFYPGIKDDEGAVSAYIASDRRLPFGDGMFRHYPELDRESGDA
ncbi:glutathione S-transferase protein-like protein [Phyllosticta citrichinensis]|uniref:Glutathione S-transferase protein-like protein n=1 Tax=Phyllosticta citrichinensis TaxID=1130410 RepID=A0ABR1XGV3_9PEZI